MLVPYQIIQESDLSLTVLRTLRLYICRDALPREGVDKEWNVKKQASRFCNDWPNGIRYIGYLQESKKTNIIYIQRERERDLEIETREIV